MNEIGLILIGMVLIGGLQLAAILVFRRSHKTVVEYVQPGDQVGVVDATDAMWHLHRRAYEYGALVWNVAEATQLFGTHWRVLEIHADGRLLVAALFPPHGYGEFLNDRVESGSDYETGSDTEDSQELDAQYAGPDTAYLGR